jgi:hypothetical protein
MLQEENQLLAFVRRAMRDADLRQQLASDPQPIFAQEGFSSRLISVLEVMLPKFAAGDFELSSGRFNFWM